MLALYAKSKRKQIKQQEADALRAKWAKETVDQKRKKLDRAAKRQNRKNQKPDSVKRVFRKSE